MITTAKFESECARCEQLIREGEKINWEPGESSASHVKCLQSDRDRRRVKLFGLRQVRFYRASIGVGSR